MATLILTLTLLLKISTEQHLHHVPHQLGQPIMRDITRSAATWILKTRELHRLPLSVMSDIMADMQSFFETVQENTMYRVKQALCNADVDTSVINVVTRV